MPRILFATLFLTVLAIPAFGAQQVPTTPPPEAATYEVRFSFAGHLGSLASAPDCPVRQDGTAEMSGTVWGLEDVDADEDIDYWGVLTLDVDIDLCEAADDRLCRITVVGGGPVNVQLTVYADDRGGYVKATRGKGVFGARGEGSCEADAVDAELEAFPDNSMANPFNGTELDLPSGPLRVGRYENEEAVVEVVRVVRRP